MRVNLDRMLNLSGRSVRDPVIPQVFVHVRSCAKLSLKAESAIFRVRTTAQRRLAVIREKQSDAHPEPKATDAALSMNGHNQVGSGRAGLIWFTSKEINAYGRNARFWHLFGNKAAFHFDLLLTHQLPSRFHVISHDRPRSVRIPIAQCNY